MNEITFRKAYINDVELVLSFINKIAVYDHLESEVVATTKSLKEWLFDKHLCEVIFVVKNQKEVGFALYFYNFSTFNGKAGIHLEDFYVDENERHKGYGKALFKEVINEAIKMGAGRLEWTCLKRNENSINFYNSLGAKQMNEWYLYRLCEDQFIDAIKK
jgi:GNAT superfamily N-acetyltransferase